MGKFLFFAVFSHTSLCWVRASQAALEAPEDISRTQALALASSNLEKLLGLEVQAELADLVAMEAGDILDFESKSVGVISPRKGIVDLF